MTINKNKDRSPKFEVGRPVRVKIYGEWFHATVTKREQYSVIAFDSASLDSPPIHYWNWRYALASGAIQQKYNNWYDNKWFYEENMTNGIDTHRSNHAD